MHKIETVGNWLDHCCCCCGCYCQLLNIMQHFVYSGLMVRIIKFTTQSFYSQRNCSCANCATFWWSHRCSPYGDTVGDVVVQFGGGVHDCRLSVTRWIAVDLFIHSQVAVHSDLPPSLCLLGCVLYEAGGSNLVTVYSVRHCNSPY